MNVDPRLLTPIAQLFHKDGIPVDLPVDVEQLEGSDSQVFYTDYELLSLKEGIGFQLTIVITKELSFQLPGLQEIALVFGGATGEGTTSFRLTVFVGKDNFELRADDIEIALRFPPSILKPVAETEDNLPPPYAEIALRGGITLDQNLDFRFDGFDRLSLPPMMIADSGVIISADDVLVDLSRTKTIPEVLAGGFDESFIGVFIGEAKVKLPDGLPSIAPEDLVLRNAAIGSGGVSGRLEAHYEPTYNIASKTFSGQGAGDLFGIPFGLKNVGLEIRQNAFQESTITGEMLLPFFEKRVSVDVGLNLDGSLTANVTGTAEPDDSIDPASGLWTLNKDGILNLKFDSIGFEISGGVFTTKLSGQVIPLVGKEQGLDWPSFEVKELAIDSEGNVHLDGGWLDLREQYSLDFHGFQMDITKLGFGKTEDGGKWIGFSGGLKLVDGLSAGASVEGLRITWYDDDETKETKITFNGIGVELDVPDVLYFKGSVSYDEANNKFSGAIKLDLKSLDFIVDGVFVVGLENGQTYMAIYLAAELPSGIPLWSTGLSLYGMAGLFALRMEPNKLPDEEWYGSGEGEGWYKRPEIGVTDLINKWSPRPGSLAFGAGVTIGTLSDNGYAFSGKMLLAIVFPGPILLLEGKANLLKERSQLNGEEEPNFRALAVLDNRAGSFQFGLDAQYKRDDTGKLIDIRGSAEAFFDFHDHDAWHLYLGEREPREKRIRAEIFKLFEVDGYFMLDANQLAMGAWVGYDKEWKFGPLHVDVEAWAESNVIVNSKPTHFHGDLWLHGTAELSVWRFGTSLTVDAQIKGDVFDPFHLLGEFSVGINLPWPLPDFGEDIILEWGPEPIRPPLPIPLKEIAVEHFKVTTSWPLPRGTFLLPNYDRGDGFLVNEGDLPIFDEHAEPPTDVPVVPLDCRPHITFGRAMNDDARIGGNQQPLNHEWERIGDPAADEGPVRVRYGLKEVVLEKWIGPDWVPVARKGVVLDPDPLPELAELFGSWAPVPAEAGIDGGSVAQTKLWIWSKNPFDYTRHAGRAWDEWFTDRFTDYPCLPTPPDREICCDFEKIGPGEEITSPWLCPDYPKLKLSWNAPDKQTVTVLGGPVEGLTNALCFPNIVHGEHKVNEITIELSEPVKAVKIVLIAEGGARATGFDTQGNAYGPFIGGQPNDPHLEITGENLTRIVIRGKLETCILKICVVVGISIDEITQREELEQHLRDEMARWAQEDDVLEPHTTYRLRVVTTVQAEGDGDLSDFSEELEQTEFAFFRTEGPPGLAKLSKPLGSPETAEFESGLDNLTRYVEQTIPPSVAAVDEKPVLARPVYCAYDVGVEFNENYVDLMYRLEQRDLGLYLFDNNNRPIRDVQGRLIVLSNRWGVTEALTLTENDERWINVVNASSCAIIDTATISQNKMLTSAAEGQVLEPDTFYEARLVPLLLHEAFSEDLAGWEKIDEGTNQGPSNWEVHSHKTLKGKEATVSGTVMSLDGSPDLSVLEPNFDAIFMENDTGRPSRLYSILSVDDAANTVIVDGEPNLSVGSSAWEIPGRGAVVQTSNIWGGTLDGTDPVKPGTILLRGDPTWTDYRLSVIVSSADDDAFGVILRYLDENNYYQYSLDQQRKYRRLVRVALGEHTILAEDKFVYRQNQDYLITVDAIGSLLNIYQDGVPIFNVVDDCVARGRIGLYSWGNMGVRFSDVRVDDFRPDAPVVYRFQFTTSDFADFFHHLHSFQDEVWRLALPEDADVTADIAQAVALSIPPSDDEARAYESLATQVFGTAALQNPAEMQVTRVERNDEALAVVIRSPEPIDWKRTDLEILHAERLDSRSELPGGIKLTDVTFGKIQPIEESVTLLLREATNLSKHSIEVLRLPGPVVEPTGDPVLFDDEFDSQDSGMLLHEEFGPNALDNYTIIDEGTNAGPSSWGVSNGHIEQKSNIFGGSVEGTDLAKPGTMALTGSQSWSDVRIKTSLRSKKGAIGFVFRYQDADNYYHFSMSRKPTYRRLTKNIGGTVSVLWEDDLAYSKVQTYQLEIVACGNMLMGYLNEVLLFSVQNPELSAGRVGFYCWANTGAHFEGLSVETMEMPCVLWQPAFTNLDEVVIVDEIGTIEGPSEWTVDDGVLSQSTNIHADVGLTHQPGTFTLGNTDHWDDFQIMLRLRSDSDGSIGVMFRVTPLPLEEGESEEVQDYSYYRFSMNRQENYRRLEKMIGNTVTVLWQDTAKYSLGQTYNLTIRAEGSELRGYIDGTFLFAAYDSELQRGQIGFYCSANAGAHFTQVVVTDRTRKVNHWTIHDEGHVSAPSIWQINDGALSQLSNLNGGNLSGTEPVKPGTIAVAGNPAWTDYRLTVRLHSDDDDAIGVIFRYVDNQNYYRLSMDQQRSYRRLTKKENGTVSVLWEDSGGCTVGDPFTITVDAIGSRLVGTLENDHLFNLIDSSHAAGQIGLYCWGNTAAHFEQVEVRQPPLEAYALLRDRFANGDISDWSFVDEEMATPTSIWSTFEGTLRQTSNIFSLPIDRDTLDKKGTQAIAGDPTWTDVIMTVRLLSLDDDAIGLLFRYADVNNYYRFSMDSQRGYRRLVKNVGGTFSLLWEDNFAYEVGQSYEITFVMIGNTLRGYLNGLPMFVVEDSELAGGRIGLYCWGNDDVRFSNVCVYPADLVFSEWLLDEPFDVLIPSRWTFVDEGDQEGPSNWEVTEGELRQMSNIFGGNTEGSIPDKPGTQALAGDNAWTDYRISVRLRSDDEDAIGVMFRHQDADNYYRFSMDHLRSYRRLIKKVEGQVSLLWEDAAQYTLGREYILTLSCVGKQLSGYLDGVQIFTIEDSSLAAGRIGLYCWGNTEAHFAEVQIAAPAWIPYYNFKNETRLPAGTRVKVYAGNAADAPPEEAGVVRRFIPSLDERGQLRLPIEGVDLRVRVLGQSGGHVRHFLPDSDYAPVDGILVLRKADGTGFFLLPSPTGSIPTTGQHRLKLTYLRDNRASDPDSQVFSHAGNSDPEHVTIDVPGEVLAS